MVEYRFWASDIDDDENEVSYIEELEEDTSSYVLEAIASEYGEDTARENCWNDFLCGYDEI